MNNTSLETNYIAPLGGHGNEARKVKVEHQDLIGASLSEPHINGTAVRE